VSLGRALRWAQVQSPFLWITVAPIVTLPLSAFLLYQFGGEHDPAELGLPPGELCHLGGVAKRCFVYYDFWRTALLFLLPGSINLLALLWVFSGHSYLRLAAVCALVIGLLRMSVVPLATIAISQFGIFSAEELYFRVETGPDHRATLQLLLAAWVGGLVAWTLTLGLWFSFEPVMARLRPEMVPPGGRRRGAPRPWLAAR